MSVPTVSLRQSDCPSVEIRKAGRGGVRFHWAGKNGGAGESATQPFSAAGTLRTILSAAAYPQVTALWRLDGRAACSVVPYNGVAQFILQ